MKYVYVIAWVSLVFGINCVSNVGRKPVIVRGAAEYYYKFPAYNTRVCACAHVYIPPASQFWFIALAIDLMHGHRPKKTNVRLY